jgi:uncharacterized protein
VACDQDQSALAGPAIRAARRAPGAELVRLPGGHYAPFSAAHEQAVAAELAFLRRHLLGQPEADQPAEGRPAVPQPAAGQPGADQVRTSGPAAAAWPKSLSR